jgi:hypothetical protein
VAKANGRISRIRGVLSEKKTEDEEREQRRLALCFLHSPPRCQVRRREPRDGGRWDSSATRWIPSDLCRSARCSRRSSAWVRLDWPLAQSRIGFFFIDLSSRGKASRVGEWASRMACSMWVHSIVHYLCLKEGLVTEERRFVDFKCLA